MSEVIINTTEPAAGDPSGPTVTRYEQLVSELSTSLKDLTARIPFFASFDPLLFLSVRAQQRYSKDFVVTAISAVTDSPGLGFNGINLSEIKDALQYVDAFRPFIDEMTTSLSNLKFTVAMIKAKAVMDALHVYGIAKRAVRNPMNVDAAPHVRNLKRDIKRKGGNKKKAPAPGTPTTTTSTGPATPPAPPTQT
jgi:hypothetical protein